MKHGHSTAKRLTGRRLPSVSLRVQWGLREIRFADELDADLRHIRGHGMCLGSKLSYHADN